MLKRAEEGRIDIISLKKSIKFGLLYRLTLKFIFIIKNWEIKVVKEYNKKLQKSINGKIIWFTIYNAQKQNPFHIRTSEHQAAIACIPAVWEPWTYQTCQNAN